MLSELKSQHEAIRHRWIVEHDSQKVNQQKMIKQIQYLQMDHQKSLAENATCQKQISQLKKEIEQWTIKTAGLGDSLKQSEKAQSRLEGENTQLQASMMDYKKQCFQLNAAKANSEANIAKLEEQLRQMNYQIKHKKATVTE